MIRVERGQRQRSRSRAIAGDEAFLRGGTIRLEGDKQAGEGGRGICQDSWEQTDREIILPAVPMAVGVARRFSQVFFTGTAGGGDAALIASELSTRSIWHGAESFSIRIVRDTRWGRIEVKDATHGTWIAPERWQIPEPGLSLVDAIASRVGHTSHPVNGQMLWAEIQWDP